MKRFLSFILALTLTFVFVGISTQEVAATDAACTTSRTVFVHYHRWDETYTDTTIHAWGYGTAGSGAGNGVSEIDGYGAVYQICVDDDADAELGLILKYGAAWGDDWNDRDGLNLDGAGGKDNKSVTIKDDDGFVGFDENGIKHIYTLEGSNDIFYTDNANSLPYSDTLATVALVYYDTAESYDGWNVWSFNNGTLGTKGDPIPGDSGEGLAFNGALSVDGDEMEMYRVVFIQVDPADVGDTAAFIVRDNSWTKKFDGDVNITTTGMVAGGFYSAFYVSGEGTVLDTWEAFDAKVNFFEVTTAVALDPNAIEVEFSKDIITKVDDVDVFDATKLTVYNKDMVEVTVASISYNSVEDVNSIFTIITDTALTGAGSPYTVKYVDAEAAEFTKEFTVDSVEPTINILGPKTVELDLGATYSLPSFNASDAEGDESVSVYNVRVKTGHGTVDTRNTGTYEVVITAHDKFGNVAEETITVTVVDPCAEVSAKSAGINPSFIALLVGIPMVLAAAVTLRKSI